jgi:dTDP-4-dehydrorhamnose 3,5-epimerase
MKILKTNFKGLKIIDSKKFKDARGEFREIFRKKFASEKKKFIFTCYSRSKKNVLRGMHLQKPNAQGKYITVIKGKILDVAVDLRKNSKTYKKHFKVILSSDNCKSIFIPEGFAHGFLSLAEDNMIVYHLTNYRSKKNEIGIKWDDKVLDINWGKKKPILSKKDAAKNVSFLDYEKKYNQ